jgi:hypothetical protein
MCATQGFDESWTSRAVGAHCQAHEFRCIPCGHDLHVIVLAEAALNLPLP